MEKDVDEAKEAALEKLGKWQQREMLRLGDIMTGEYERRVERMQNEVNEKIRKEFNHIQRFFKALGEEKAGLAAKKMKNFWRKSSSKPGDLW